MSEYILKSGRATAKVISRGARIGQLYPFGRPGAHLDRRSRGLVRSFAHPVPGGGFAHR